MTRFHSTPEGNIPFTQEEEVLTDAELASFLLTQYQEQRQLAYPPIGDQLDALWKGGNAATDMLAKVQAVKAKYPKSE